MNEEPRITGWLHTLDEPQFGSELQKVLYASRAIQSPEFLRGRNEQLNDIRRAWYSEGRQIFIYGYRGVGKTSLAQTAAFQQQSSDGDPVILACSEGAQFTDIIHDMLEQGLESDPRKTQEVTGAKAKVGVRGLSAELEASETLGKVPRPESINDALRLTKFLTEQHSGAPVVIIDEFDLLKDPAQHKLFADYVKQLADQHIQLRLVFVGIGDSIDDLFSAHASAHRYFHPVNLGRLPWDARLEIIDYAADRLGISVDETSRLRIAKISDGFPHYVHLICEKLFWLVFEKGSDGDVTGDQFEEAMHKAAESMEPQLKKPYETATRKYTNDYEVILWAAADHHQLARPSSEIYHSYLRIMDNLGRQPLDRTKFNARMNNLKQPAYGSIFTASRTGWYEYTEKIIRGYARLRAMQHGVELEIEHPMQPRRFR